jgi:hypothetical protein
MSGGRQIRVHGRALPAFQQVTANLAAAAAEGKWYSISVARGQSSRTVFGKLSMSYHAFGAAVDINPAANPYRSDNVLITDMPSWFVQAWRDAGFCWGGDWLDYKDTMHFSWKGPLPTPGYAAIPDPTPPRSRPASFTAALPMPSPPFGPLDGARRYLVGDVTGHGAPDIVQLTQHESGVIVNISRANLDYAGCDVERAFAEDARLADRTVLLGDLDATARDDLWEIDASGERVVAIIHTSASDFDRSEVFTTGAMPEPDDVYLLGDADGDGRDDLYLLRRNDVTRLEVWTAASGFGAKAVDVEILASDSRSWQFAIGDRDVDGQPDVYAVDTTGAAAVVHVVTQSGGYGFVSETLATAAFIGVGEVFAMADYDGDGRDDLLVLAADGSLRAFLGNDSAAVDPARWFRDRNWECEDDSEPYWFSGTFRDDDGSIFEEDIEWLEAAGFTRGCNWPYDDGYCPDRPVTRAEMATFLARALELDAEPGDRFFDVEDPSHEPNINAIASAGITVGCSLDGSRYCPDRPVTRAEMAALLHRAWARIWF